MYLNKKRVHKRAAQRASRRFSSRDHATLTSSELKEVPHHGLPLSQFSKITFVLSGMTEDVLNQARTSGIPCPPVAKMVHHPYKEMFVVEMSDLSKRGHRIVSGNELDLPETKKLIKNADEIKKGIESDKSKLLKLGLKIDSTIHPPDSAWLVRINEKTGVAERFLWDATNLYFY
jgi:hypothetical protein